MGRDEALREKLKKPQMPDPLPSGKSIAFVA
jgi:hypothetical protein